MLESGGVSAIMYNADRTLLILDMINCYGISLIWTSWDWASRAIVESILFGVLLWFNVWNSWVKLACLAFSPTSQITIKTDGRKAWRCCGWRLPCGKFLSSYRLGPSRASSLHSSLQLSYCPTAWLVGHIPQSRRSCINNFFVWLHAKQIIHSGRGCEYKVFVGLLANLENVEFSWKTSVKAWRKSGSARLPSFTGTMSKVKLLLPVIVCDILVFCFAFSWLCCMLCDVPLRRCCGEWSSSGLSPIAAPPGRG